MPTETQPFDINQLRIKPESELEKNKQVWVKLDLPLAPSLLKVFVPQDFSLNHLSPQELSALNIFLTLCVSSATRIDHIFFQNELTPSLQLFLVLDAETDLAEFVGKSMPEGNKWLTGIDSAIEPIVAYKPIQSIISKQQKDNYQEYAMRLISHELANAALVASANTPIYQLPPWFTEGIAELAGFVVLENSATEIDDLNITMRKQITAEGPLPPISDADLRGDFITTPNPDNPLHFIWKHGYDGTNQSRAGFRIAALAVLQLLESMNIPINDMFRDCNKIIETISSESIDVQLRRFNSLAGG